MAISDPTDTLAYHSSRVLSQNRNMSAVPCSIVAKAVNGFMDNDKDQATRPETDALEFYGMNHGVALIASRRGQHEPLSPAEQTFVNDYHRIMCQKAVRAFYYLVLICTRESRHVHDGQAFDKSLLSTWGAQISGFNHMIRHTGSMQAANGFRHKPPNATLGEYVKSLAWIFYKGKFNGAYGGKKWGAVTDCLVRFVTGEFTAEMMLDTVWTLVHNGGPIFNKGMMYATQHNHILARILDIQRSGQVPEAAMTDAACKGFVTPGLQNRMSWLKQEFPDKIGNYVDWYLVEALGSVNKWQADKMAQDKLHGVSPLAAEAAKIAAAKLQAEQAADKAAEEDKLKNWFQVMPGLEVKKVYREAA